MCTIPESDSTNEPMAFATATATAKRGIAAGNVGDVETDDPDVLDEEDTDLPVGTR